MKILVTGSNGYVGKNLIPKLRELDHRVWEFDLDNDEEDEYGSNEYLLSGDLTDDLSIEEAIFSKRPDYIINLAGIMGVQHVNENYMEAMDVNIKGAYDLLIAAESAEGRFSRNNYKPHIILISNLAAERPNNIYACQKRLVEEIGKVHHKMDEQKITILRFSNIYGGLGYLEKPSVIARFIDARKNDVKAKIHGDGAAVRDFVHIDDVCQGIICAINSSPGKANIYEICSGAGSTIIEVARFIVGDKFDVDATVDCGEECNVGDWKQAEKEIGYRPKIGLKEGLEKLLKETLNE